MIELKWDGQSPKLKGSDIKEDSRLTVIFAFMFTSDRCCREPLLAGPNKGNKEVDSRAPSRMCSCL